jgi:hypothetical protein
MLVVIPYKDYRGVELKYCLRGIEKFVEDPEIIIIGDKPGWLQNVTHLPHADQREVQFKERNIFKKILLVKNDFLFFNDDHFLLKPFDKDTYHYSGNIYGDLDNYFRHGPMFCEHKILSMLTALDWSKAWGYCVKSIYCFLAGINGTEYPDLKIRHAPSYIEIKQRTKEREYFSTGDYAVNGNVIAFLDETYPHKSKFEK